MIIEIKFVTPEMRAKLRSPLPEEAIKQHPSKTYLSTIKPIYVTERLNDVFGIGVWQLRSKFIEKAEGGVIVTQTELTIPAYGIHYESYGGNDNGGDGSKGFDLGDAYKGSVTDAITKICSYMEIGIDVFKGKHGNKPKIETGRTTNPEIVKKTTPNNTTKAWLNKDTKEWEQVVKELSTGARGLDSVKIFYNVSKVNEAELAKIKQTV